MIFHGPRTFWIVASCGHQVEASSWGRHWYQAQGGKCPVCASHERTRVNEVAAGVRPEGLPELRGSVRQIKWAERIRGRLVARMARLRTVLDEGRIADGEEIDAWAWLKEHEAHVQRQVEAAWWIEQLAQNRRSTLPEIPQ